MERNGDLAVKQDVAEAAGNVICPLIALMIGMEDEDTDRVGILGVALLRITQNSHEQRATHNLGRLPE